MSRPADSFGNLERLCQDYSAALQLGQHEQVSQLCLSICQRLVQLFDDELLQNDIQGAQEEDEEEEEAAERQLADIIQSDEWQLVDLVCQRLRKQSVLAQINADIGHFVRQQDQICLAKLMRSPADGRDSAPLNPQDCATVLRKCILLLKELQHRSRPERFVQVSWLPRTQIRRLDGVGFPRHLIDLEAGERRNSRPIDELIDACLAAQENPPGERLGEGNTDKTSLFYKLLGAQWFRQFVGSSHERRLFAYDKFTLLIALWIVAGECQHAPLEQLVGELVGQMFHEETNSCNLDEFLLLSQTGAVWLSYRKRIAIGTHLRPALGPHASSDSRDLRNIEDDGEDDNEDDESQKSLPRAQPTDGLRSVSSESFGSSDSFAAATAAAPRAAGAQDYRAWLRKVIDSELFVGAGCLSCGRKPSGQPMDPIQLRECPSCGRDLMPPDQALGYCQPAFEPLGGRLLELNELQLKLVNLKQVLVLTPNEWVQRALEACAPLEATGKFSLLAAGWLGRDRRLASATNEDGEVAAGAPSEQMYISDKFERLTVVRGTRRGPRAATENEEEDEDEAPDAPDVKASDEGRESAGFGDQLGLRDDSDFENSYDADADGEAESSLVSLGPAAAPSSLPINECLATLMSFLKWRAGQLAALGRLSALPEALQFSETLQLLRWLSATAVKRRTGAGAELLAVNSNDLLELDSLDETARLALVACKHSDGSFEPREPRSARTVALRCRPGELGDSSRPAGPPVAWDTDNALLACHSRSQTSQLRRGCGRLFLRASLTKSATKGCASNCSPSEAGGPNRQASEPATGQEPDLDATLDLVQLAPIDCPTCACPLVELEASADLLGASC